MRRFARLNRARVVIIFNDCTVNGTGDLSIENDAEFDVEPGADVPGGAKPVIITGTSDLATRYLRAVATGILGALGVVTRADLEPLLERTMILEKAGPAAVKQ